MKNLIVVVLSVSVLLSCKPPKKETKEVIKVASFVGQQVTGVAVSKLGRIFVNFPRWREGVAYSVMEIEKNNNPLPFPNQEWNSWKIGKPVSDSLFIAVQSVVSYRNHLYVLDTRNPLFKGVIDNPRVFVFNIASRKLTDIYILSEGTFHQNSYINDLRLDEKNKKLYFTDSGEPGIVVFDLTTKQSQRLLDNHTSTKAEQDYLTIDGKKWKNRVHADGIAFDPQRKALYFHSLTGYSLYSIPVEKLTKEQAQSSVVKVANTAAPDGMIFDEKGNLYYADLENHAIHYLTPEGKIKVLLKSNKIKWADSFSIHNGFLYFTNSRIHETGGDISHMEFTLNKIAIAVH